MQLRTNQKDKFPLRTGKERATEYFTDQNVDKIHLKITEICLKQSQR